MNMKCEATVCGGFPIIIHFSACKAEPDVGYMNDYCELDYITTPKGAPCPWLEKKFTASDDAAIVEAMNENMEPDYGF